MMVCSKGESEAKERGLVMRRVIVLCVLVALLALAILAPIAAADPDCTGALADRASSCFNAGPGQPGFHGR